MGHCFLDIQYMQKMSKSYKILQFSLISFPYLNNIEDDIFVFVYIFGSRIFRGIFLIPARFCQFFLFSWIISKC